MKSRSLLSVKATGVSRDNRSEDMNRNKRQSKYIYTENMMKDRLPCA